MDIRYGVVVATHPEDNSVDLVMTDNFARVAGVQVLTANGNGAYGRTDLYAPDEKSGDAKWDMTKVGPKNPIACVLFGQGMPVVIGFRLPQVNQTTFAEKNLRIDRHSSEVYSSLNEAGDFEMAWPNGTFMRVGASPDHVDLNGKGTDSKFATEKNKGAATYLRLVLGNGGAVKADIKIDPDGNVSGTFKGKGDLVFEGDVTLTCPNVTVNTQKATVNASSQVELATPLVHCTQALTVDGLITGKAGMAISGGSGAVVTGDFRAQGGAFSHNGKNVGSTHAHANSGGSGTGGAPV